MLISDRTLAMVQRHKESGFYDLAQRMVIDADTPAVSSTFGYRKPVYIEGDIFPCRFLPISGSPRPAPDALDRAEVKMGDADLYFLEDQALDDRDQVRILQLHNKVQDPPLDYNIVGGPIQESMGKRATLALVTDVAVEEP